jgi:TRAP transporter TAXI family solute receptor
MSKKALCLVITVLLMISIVGCGSQKDAGKEDKAKGGDQVTALTWAATSQSSGFFPFNVAIAEIINKNIKGVNVTVLETGGTVDNLKLIEQGRAHFGQSGDPDMYEAINGVGAFKGHKFTKSRTIWAAHPKVYFFVVSEQSGVKNYTDLQGKLFNPGLQGSTTEAQTYAILDALGVKPNFAPGGLSDAIDAVKDRRIIGFSKTASAIAPDSSIQNIMTAVKVRVLSLTDEEIKTLQAKLPQYKSIEIDGGLYNQPGKIKALSGVFGTMVSKDLPEELVYKIVKAVFENQRYIEQAYPALKGFDMAKVTAEQATSWLHPGTIKYLREKGYKLPDQVIPPEMKK